MSYFPPLAQSLFSGKQPFCLLIHTQKIVDALSIQLHGGDYILDLLINYGGIYFDTDVLALRSFDPLLNLSDVVMANQDYDTKQSVAL